MGIAIKVENLSKAYQLGQFGTGTLSSDLSRWWALKRGLEDPYLKIGEENNRSSKGKSNIVWSLKDLNFNIEQGSAIGIIGKNGAGKSTLLKILSQITSPTSGKAFVRGRIASLLEVGTGFHPELSGRENIYLNGAILGMRKAEINRKFDEIVDFSGVERYIDTPVKRYSSGMYVRLAFAVAAHLESEILIVDEVLAVGDDEFQKKCLGKMGDISSNQGRTILFVSHNMNSIKHLCTEGIVLSNGIVNYSGSIEQCVNLYTQNESQEKTFWTGRSGRHNCYLLSSRIYTNASNLFDNSSDLFLEIEYELLDDIRDLVVGFNLYSINDDNLVCCVSGDYNDKSEKIDKIGVNKKTFKIPKWTLASGTYKIHIDLSIHGVTKFNNIEDGQLIFSITNKTGKGMRFFTGESPRHNSIIRPNWEVLNVN